MKKILVVDDSPFMLTLISDMLTKLNYKVTTEQSGNSACLQVRSNRFDLIITDLNMPGMDGIELTRQIRDMANSKFVPIVMLSSEEDQERIATARKLGISTFLSKPPREAQLRSILQIVLNKRDANRFNMEFDVDFGPGYMMQARSSNISTKGLFLQTDEPMVPGTTTDLRFTLPGQEKPFCCRARVAWTFANGDVNPDQPAGMGMEFLDLEDIEQLRSIIEKR